MRFEETPRAFVAYFANSRIRDELLIKQISRELVELVGKVPKGKLLVLDFAAVRSMSSEMIGELVLLKKKSKAADVEVRLRNICPPIMSIFTMTRLDKVFHISEGNDD